MVNEPLNFRRILWVLLPCAVVLVLAAWLRGAEYDEQYTLFLTAGVARPDWPVTVFPAGLARELQSGHASFAAIARDLRTGDVHPPLYFWLVSTWRALLGHDLFVARLLSVALGLGALALIGVMARTVGLPATRAMLLTLGCYGFTYTSVIARGFALAQLLVLGGAACLLMPPPKFPRHRGIPRFVVAGMLFGAASFTNYLAVFSAGGCLLALCLEAIRPLPDTTNPNKGRSSNTFLYPVMARLVRATRPGMVPREVARTSRAMTMEVEVNLLTGRRNTTPAVPAVEPRPRWRHRMNRSAATRALLAIVGFLAFIPADLWWFLAQRNARVGQFPPFSLFQSLSRLAARSAGAIIGGLPLYVDGIASPVLAAALGLALLGLAAGIVWRWPAIATSHARIMFGMAALAPAVGLLALGAAFDNTPIEVRYMAFSTPFVALLLAGALSARTTAVLLCTQAASIAGLMLAPQTMQPARAATHAASGLVGDGIVVLPRGNDGVGVVGGFAIEAPPALPLLVIQMSDSPARIRARVGAARRVVLVLLEQDDASRATSQTMRQAMATPDWREVARGPHVEVYERAEPAE